MRQRIVPPPEYVESLSAAARTKTILGRCPRCYRGKIIIDDDLREHVWSVSIRCSRYDPGQVKSCSNFIQYGYGPVKKENIMPELSEKDRQWLDAVRAAGGEPYGFAVKIAKQLFNGRTDDAALLGALRQMYA